MIISVKVKPNSPKTEILSEGAVLEVAVAAPAENNRANIELIKFLGKKFKKKARIIRGLTSKNKVVCLD
ncbi:MAG: DUF167 domain-containing protein [archaeon]